MDMFDNFVLLYLSNFKLEEKSTNFLSKKPSKIYFSAFSFCTLIMHQFSECELVRIAALLGKISAFLIRVLFYPTSVISYPRFILHPHFLIRVLSSISIFIFAFYPTSAFFHPYFLIRYPYPYPRFIPTIFTSRAYAVSRKTYFM